MLTSVFHGRNHGYCSIHRGKPLASVYSWRFKRLASVASFSFLLAGTGHAGQPLDVEVFAGYDSNPSRGLGGNSISGENIYGASLSMTNTRLVDEHSGLAFRSSATLLEHARYRDLDHLIVNANLRYRVQPSIGYTQPWYQLLLNLERRQFARSAMRNATDAGLEVTAGKYFTDRIQASAGFGITRSLADHGQVFDRSERRIFASAAYKLDLANTLYANLAHIVGDQIFGADESSYLVGGVKASAEDPAFGYDFYAYRMAATANVAEVGVTLPLPGTGTWDLSAKGVRTTADHGPAYAYRQLLLSWRYRFF